MADDPAGGAPSEPDWMRTAPFATGLACAILLLFLLEAVHLAATQRRAFWTGAATACSLLFLVWLPLSAAAWRRLQRLLRDARRRRFGAVPVQDGAGAWLARAAAALLGGSFTVAAIVLLGADAAYPWHLLSFALGASGGLLLVDLARLCAFVLANPLSGFRKPNPFHPDRYGGFGAVAEDAASLIGWILVLLLLGNLFFLTPRLIPAELQPAARQLQLGGLAFSLDWARLLRLLAVLCSGLVLLLYLAFHVSLGELFRDNRRKAIAEWEEKFQAARAPSAAVREGLEKALAMKTAPAPVRAMVENAVLAAMNLLGFVAALGDVGLRVLPG